MVSSSAGTVEQYLASLPADRRASVAAVRDVVNRNLPAGFVEGMGFGMIAWTIPLARFPTTYNQQPLGVAALAAQKHGLSLYLMGVYGSPKDDAWLRGEWAKTGKKLDMGKSCVRFRSADELPLELIGRTIARVGVDEMIRRHDAAHSKDARAARSQARKKR